MRTLIPFILVSILASSAHATHELASLDFHFSFPNYGGCIEFDDDVMNCSDLDPNAFSGPAGFNFLWVVVTDIFDPATIGGLSFAVTYPGTVNFDYWTLCTGGSETPQAGWPTTGTGNAVAWPNGCYDPLTDVASVGFFQLQPTTGFVEFTCDPRIGLINTVDCGGVERSLPYWCQGRADTSIGSGDGELNCGFDCGLQCEACGQFFCGPVPTEESSWGRVKSTYR